MRRGGSLYLMEEPFLDESLSSWLLRSAQLHGASAHELVESVGMRREKDIDLNFGVAIIDRILERVEIDRLKLMQVSSVFSNFSRCGWARPWLRADDLGWPITGYCPACLEEDDGVPYWRMAWRFRFWVVCPTHYRPIQDQCLECCGRFDIFRYLARRPRRDGQSWLAICCACDIPVRMDEKEYSSSHEADALVGLQSAVMSSLLRGGFSVEGREGVMPLDLLPRVLLEGAIKGLDRDVGLESLPRRKAKFSLDDDSLISSVETQLQYGQPISSRRWGVDTGWLADLALKTRFLWPLQMLKWLD